MPTERLYGYDGHEDHEVHLVEWMNFEQTHVTGITVDCLTCRREIASIMPVPA